MKILKWKIIVVSNITNELQIIKSQWFHCISHSLRNVKKWLKTWKDNNQGNEIAFVIQDPLCCFDFL